MFQAIILGLVQGISEFLPISSSAHLIIIPKIFHWSDPGLAFDVALHLGTLVAILIYFRNDIIKIIRSFFQSIANKKISSFDEKMAWFLVVGSIPGAIIGALLEKRAESSFRNLLLVAITLLVFGLILLWQDKVSAKIKKLTDMTWKDSIIIGLVQCIAIIPGVSRSGATITGGLFRGFKREDAAKFSFLLAAPVMAGAGLLEIRKIIGLIDLNVVVSFLVAMLTGILAIKLLLGYVKKNNLKVFVFYRLVLALVLFVLYLYGYK